MHSLVLLWLIELYKDELTDTFRCWQEVDNVYEKQSISCSIISFSVVHHHTQRQFIT